VNGNVVEIVALAREVCGNNGVQCVRSGPDSRLAGYKVVCGVSA